MIAHENDTRDALNRAARELRRDLGALARNAPTANCSSPSATASSAGATTGSSTSTSACAAPYATSTQTAS
jgi:hypothetical protein